MKVSCSIEHSRVALGFEDTEGGLKFIYIKGLPYEPSSSFFVKNEDFYGRDDMSPEERDYALKAIDAFNAKNAWQIVLVDD